MKTIINLAGVIYMAAYMGTNPRVNPRANTIINYLYSLLSASIRFILSKLYYILSRFCYKDPQYCTLTVTGRDV